MENPVRAFIFDMDGTLVDNMAYHAQAWLTLLEELGSPLDGETFLRRTAGLRNPEIAQLLLGSAGVGSSRQIRLFQRKEALYRSLYAPHQRPLPGLLAFLAEAERRGIPMAVATSAPPENIPYTLDGLDIRGYFRVVVGGDDVARGKPHPDGFLRAAELLGVEPAACLVFEDSLNGLEAARRAGMSAVALTTTHTAEELAPHAARVVADFRPLHLTELIDN